MAEEPKEKPVEPAKEADTSEKEPTEEGDKDHDKKVQTKLVDEAEVSEDNSSDNSSTEQDAEERENNSPSNLAEEVEEETQKTESLKEMDLKDVLKINSMNIDFGELFPGQILEETVIILNNLAATKVPFKIKINCLSKEFDDLDEYVYSMRRPTTQDVFNYNDTFLILLAQKAISYYKLAIKVPNIMEEKEILGNIEISCTECQNGVITIPIKSTIGMRRFGTIWGREGVAFRPENGETELIESASQNQMRKNDLRELAEHVGGQTVHEKYSTPGLPDFAEKHVADQLRGRAGHHQKRQIDQSKWKGLTPEHGFQLLPAANHDPGRHEHEFHNDGAVAGSPKQK